MDEAILLADRVVMEDLNGQSRVEMVYDSQGRIDREIQGAHEVRSRYNGRGQRTGIAYPNNGRAFSFVRDGMSRLRRIEESGALVSTLDLELARRHRASWGFFRDRRPQLYGRICEDI